MSINFKGRDEDIPMYTASTAFLEALSEAGVTHIFANLGAIILRLSKVLRKGK